jgi:flagellar export protein FliJ
MADFRFRAQAALDLRRKQEDAAAAAFADAEAAVQRVVAQQAATRDDRARALAAQLLTQREGTHAAALEWHWNWINGLGAAIERLGRDLEARRLEAGAAQRVWQEARRRRLVIERMRDRLLRRYQAEMLRKESRTVDELARLRFVMPDATSGGVNRDD